jgi:hypothetical protein
MKRWLYKIMSEFNNGTDTYEKGKFIQIYQKYIREDHPQQLTPKELHTVIVLRNHTTTLNHNLTITTLNMLGHLLPFAKHSETKRNAVHAKEVLEALRAKDIVDYTDPVDNNTPFKIALEEIKHKNTQDTQFLAVPDYILETTDIPEELYVLIVIYNIARWDDKYDNSKPYFRNKRNWHGLLSVKSPTTAENVINQMIKKQILFFYENDCVYNQAKEKFDQDNGKYYLVEQLNEQARVDAMRQKEEENRKKREEYEEAQQQEEVKVKSELAFHKGTSSNTDISNTEIDKFQDWNEEIDEIHVSSQDDTVLGFGNKGTVSSLLEQKINQMYKAKHEPKNPFDHLDLLGVTDDNDDVCSTYPMSHQIPIDEENRLAELQLEDDYAEPSESERKNINNFWGSAKKSSDYEDEFYWDEPDVS